MKQKIFALGFFDGVHKGHQMVLAQCKLLAEDCGVTTAAITFEQHPQSLFAPNPPALLNTTDDRCALLRQYEIDEVFVLHVNEKTMSIPWDAFLEMLIKDGAVGFVCGYDFRFGKNGEGTAEKLALFAAERDLPCIIVPEQVMDGEKISSTRIRTLLENGDVENATRLLGHPHIFTGTVVSGRKLGRTIGIPTANLQLPNTLLTPAFGVYACIAVVDGHRYVAVTNIGTRPTVGGSHVTVEPWILDFSGNLYGKEITLEFHKFLRPEQKFANLEELKAQIQRDAAEACKILK